MPKNTKKLITNKRFSKPSTWIFIAIFAAIGGFVLFRSFAATSNYQADAPAAAIARAGGNSQYWIATKDGKVYGLGGVNPYGRDKSNDYEPRVSGQIRPVAKNIVAMAAQPEGVGYRLLGQDCKVYGFGNAKWEGDAKQEDRDECRAIVATSDGGGYWVITKLGRITAFGYAKNISGRIDEDKKWNNNAAGVIKAGLPGEGIVAAARSGDGSGLLLLDAKGTIYTYGDISQYRDDKKVDANGAVTTELNWVNSGNSAFDYAGGARASAIAITRSEGFIVTGQGGKVYTYRNANKQSPGSNPNRGGSENVNPKAKIVGVAYTADYAGYWQLAEDGSVYVYGNAVNSGRVQAPTHNCGNNVYAKSAALCPKASTASGTGSSSSSSGTRTGTTSPSGSAGSSNQGSNAASGQAVGPTAQVIEGCYTKTLRKGDKGACVEVLGIALFVRRVQGNYASEMNKKEFGAGIEDAVKKFQSEQRLQNDGVVGQQTWSKLKSPNATSGTRLPPQPSSGNSKCDVAMALYNAVYARYKYTSVAARTRTQVYKTLSEANDQLFQARVNGIYTAPSGPRDGQAIACGSLQALPNYPKIHQSIGRANDLVSEAIGLFLSSVGPQ